MKIEKETENREYNYVEFGMNTCVVCVFGSNMLLSHIIYLRSIGSDLRRYRLVSFRLGSISFFGSVYTSSTHAYTVSWCVSIYVRRYIWYFYFDPVVRPRCAVALTRALNTVYLPNSISHSICLAATTAVYLFV